MGHGMIYTLYLGRDQAILKPIASVCPGMLMPVNGLSQACQEIEAIRERYNTMLLVESGNAATLCPMIAELHKRYPRVYIILVTAITLQGDERKLYLKAGVNNMITPDVTMERMNELGVLLSPR